MTILIITMDNKRIYKNIMMKSFKIIFRKSKKRLLESQQLRGNSFRILRLSMRMKLDIRVFHQQKNLKLSKHLKINKSPYLQINSNEYLTKYKSVKK